MFQTKGAEEIKTYIVCSTTFYLENRAVYEIMWKNIVQRGRPQMTIWRMRVACWIPKSKNTLTLCKTYCFSTETMVARTRLSVTLCIHCLSCYILSSGLQKLAEKMSYGWLRRFVSYRP